MVVQPRFVYDLVKKPNDKLSHDAAQIYIVLICFFSFNYRKEDLMID